MANTRFCPERTIQGNVYSAFHDPVAYGILSPSQAVAVHINDNTQLSPTGTSLAAAEWLVKLRLVPCPPRPPAPFPAIPEPGEDTDAMTRWLAYAAAGRTTADSGAYTEWRPSSIFRNYPAELSIAIDSLPSMHPLLAVRTTPLAAWLCALSRPPSGSTPARFVDVLDAVTSEPILIANRKRRPAGDPELDHDSD